MSIKKVTANKLIRPEQIKRVYPLGFFPPKKDKISILYICQSKDIKLT